MVRWVGSEQIGTSADLSYIDDALAHVGDGEVPFWRHLHWGLFDDPEVEDDDPFRYHVAAQAMTEHVVHCGQVRDGAGVLDVGCGFGGTLDMLRRRAGHDRLVGVNIDERQLRQGRDFLVADDEAARSIGLVAGDGCRLPVADASVDHVVAVECVFHFPSRKRFLREVARVLRPGGTVALTDFLCRPGGLRELARSMAAVGVGDQGWYGHTARPLTPESYGRLARAMGFDVLVDEDLTARTLPTYPALRRLYKETDAQHGVQTVDSLEELSIAGVLQYHVLSFRRRLGTDK
jgi:ubiquinone/menaquinone biosynthesis C-methylase UbiE